jgi:hypothetical protein
MINVSEYQGSYVRRETDTHKVSFWHIPNGADYEHARAVLAYFPSEETAVKFEQKHSYPPEMAVVVPI